MADAMLDHAHNHDAENPVRGCKWCRRYGPAPSWDVARSVSQNVQRKLDLERRAAAARSAIPDKEGKLG